MIDTKQNELKAAHALEHSHAQADAVFSSIGDGAIAVDENGRISRINQAALDILGYELKDLLGKWFPSAIVACNESGSVVDPLERPILRSVLSGKVVSEKTFYKLENGDLLPVSVTVSPIMLGRKPIGAVEVFRDVSLEHEIDRMKSEFISLASHQLRTPLSAINTYSLMLAEGFQGDLNKGQEEFLKRIIISVNRMNELINALLDIARLETGKVGVRRTKTDLKKLLGGIVTEQWPAINEKNLDLTIRQPQEPILLATDAQLVVEVYANFLSNAIKYTPDGGQLEVTLYEKGGEVIFSVKDNGYGIPLSAQERVFTKFFRATNILQKDTVGTGLGLYMVKQIADTLGGRVWFKSKEGSGSTFYFALPGVT